MPKNLSGYRFARPLVFLALVVLLMSMSPGIASASPFKIKIAGEVSKEVDQDAPDPQKQAKKAQKKIQEEVEIQISEAQKKSDQEQAKKRADTEAKRREAERKEAERKEAERRENEAREAADELKDQIQEEVQEASRDGSEPSSNSTNSGDDGVSQSTDIIQSSTTASEDDAITQQGSDSPDDNQLIEGISPSEDGEPTSESYTLQSGSEPTSSEADSPPTSQQTETPSTSEEGSDQQAPDSEGKLSREGVYFPLPAENSDDFEDDYSESRSGEQHAANDISADEGTPVYSITPGTVVEVYVDSYGANVVKVQSSETAGPVTEGDVFTYGHLYEPAGLAEGESVSAGEQIALSGNTGNSTGPHLHVGWETAGGYANPYDLWQWILDDSSSEGSLSTSSEQQPNPSSQPSPSVASTGDDSVTEADEILADIDVPDISFDD